MARASRSAQREPKEDTFAVDALEYITLRDRAKVIKTQMDSLKSRIMSVVDKGGRVDDKGNKWFDFPEPVLVGDVEYRGFERRRVPKEKLNEAAAFELLEEKGLLEECTMLVRQIDEEALAAAVWEKKITPEDLETMYPVEETFALYVTKA